MRGSDDGRGTLIVAGVTIGSADACTIASTVFRVATRSALPWGKRNDSRTAATLPGSSEGPGTMRRGGAAMSTTSTTLAKDVYAFPFGQKGLMAGLGLEGSNITPIRR